MIQTSPLTIVSQRKRYKGVTEAKIFFEVGDVVDFELEGRRACSVRQRTFDGTVEFVGLRGWAPGRWGVVTHVYPAPEPGARIVDGLSGDDVARERDDKLKVGDLVYYDLMSDFVALELSRIVPKKS